MELVSSCKHHDALIVRGRLSDRFRINHRVLVVRVAAARNNTSTGFNVCVRESHCGGHHWLARGRRNIERTRADCRRAYYRRGGCHHDIRHEEEFALRNGRR